MYIIDEYIFHNNWYMIHTQQMSFIIRIKYESRQRVAIIIV